MTQFPFLKTTNITYVSVVLVNLLNDAIYVNGSETAKDKVSIQIFNYTEIGNCETCSQNIN